ncbi:MAG: lipopolysaccharide biosynthesis protein, partial [Aquihabitans sp.]
MTLETDLPPEAELVVRGVRARAVEHLRSPLTRNGYALLLASVITSVLGMGYWILAARLYSETALGRGAALVSAMLLVTSLATAGLKRSLIRFVPTAGRHAPLVVLRIYAVGLGIALAGGIVFLTGVRDWSKDLTMLHGGGGAPALFFLLGIAAWGLFVLQDAVLVGAHRATLVPVTNTVFAV